MKGTKYKKMKNSLIDYIDLSTFFIFFFRTNLINGNYMD